MYETGIQDLEVLCLETIYRTDIVRRVQEEAIEMLNSQKAYQILITEVGQMSPPLLVGPPPQIPPQPPEEGFQMIAALADPVGNPSPGSYHVPNAYGGHIISPDGITPANPEVFLENVSLKARQPLRGGLRVAFHIDGIMDPHRLQVEAIHISFAQRLTFEEMHRLSITDSIFHP